MKLHKEKGTEFNLKTHLVCLDCVKAFDRFMKEANCLKYYKTKVFPVYY
jgi:hypothetical protein